MSKIFNNHSVKTYQTALVLALGLTLCLSFSALYSSLLILPMLGLGSQPTQQQPCGFLELMISSFLWTYPSAASYSLIIQSLFYLTENYLPPFSGSLISGTKWTKKQRTDTVLSRVLQEAEATYISLNNHNTVLGAALEMWSPGS